MTGRSSFLRRRLLAAGESPLITVTRFPEPEYDKLFLQKLYLTGMDRREILTASGVVLSTGLAGCLGDRATSGDGNGGGGDNETTAGGTDDEPSGGNNSNPESDDEQASNSEGTDGRDLGDAAPYSLSGSGSTVVDGISTEKGLTIFEASYTGAGPFRVVFGDATIFDESGAYDGETASMAGEDEYTLEVEADGDWELEIRQPRPESGQSLPQSLSGEGDSVHGPFEFARKNGVTATHSGDGEFGVVAMPKRGWPNEIINESGTYEGKETFTFGGLGWIAVFADGEWTLEIDR